LIQIIASFSAFSISQGSVATHLMCVGISINSFICKIPTECVGERNMKIGQYLAKIWTRV